MNYCKACEVVFDDDEELRCPRCWGTEDSCYAVLRLEELEERDG